MDREIPPEIIKKEKIKKYIKIGLSVVLIIVILYLISSFISPSISRSEILTSIAEIGTIEATITASGVVVPEYEQVITSPINSKIIKNYLGPGDSVQAGQSILNIDKEFIQLELENNNDELKLLLNQKEQLNLLLEKTKIDLQSQYEIKLLQVEFKKSEYERTKHLCNIGGKTTEDLDYAHLAFQIADKELKQVTAQIENQKATLAANLEENNLQIKIQKNRIDEIRLQLELAEAKSIEPGIVTWVNDNIGASVISGEVIARVADLSSFKIDAKISDIHVEKLSVGQKVNVRINDDILNGVISIVRPTVEEGIVSFEVRLIENAHKALRSNLRVDVYVVTSFKDNIIRVRNGPFYNGKRNQKVFVIENGNAFSKTVDIGVSNFEYVELIGDIKKGDEVIVSNTKEYSHMNEIEVDE